VKVEPLDATFGAVVTGVKLADLDDDAFAAVHAAWLEHGLLIFREQHLTKDEQTALAMRFGEIELQTGPITNIDKEGRVHSELGDEIVKSFKGNEGWHHDSTYMPVQAKGAVFTAEIVPTSGGATGFADMRAAYDALDPETHRKVGELCAYHSLVYSQTRVGMLPSKLTDEGTYAGYGYSQQPQLRPLVKVHPETGMPNLIIGRHAHDIVGMEADESLRLLDHLNEWACQGPRIHYHEWTVGDAVIWDNRRLMHRATPYDLTEPRRMWHTRIAGERETESSLNAA